MEETNPAFQMKLLVPLYFPLVFFPLKHYFYGVIVNMQFVSCFLSRTVVERKFLLVDNING